jgi:hypothetical protein
MPSTYTTNGGIELPANGEQSGTWGETVNDNMAIIDRLTNGVGAISLSGTTHTLTTTDGTLSDGQYNVLVLGGSPSGTNTITISPNDGEHVYIVKNASGQTATFTQGSGANVSVINNTTKIIYADGAGAGAAVVDITGALDLGSLIIAGTTTITAVLDEDNMASDSATALATQQSIKAYVDAQVGTVDTLAEILAIGNTTGATDIAVDSAQKVQFRDAAIYINSSVDGQLDIVADTEIQIAATTVDLNGNLDVSGDIDVDGSVSITDAVNAKLSLSGPISSIDMYDTSSVNSNTRFESHSNGLFIKALNDDGTATQHIIELNCSNGNIIFFDNTSTEGVHWNAATKRLGIGTVSAATALDVTGTITADGLTVDGDTVTANAQNAVTVEFNNATGIISADRTGGNYAGLSLRTTAGSTPLERLAVAYNGDISFYEATGTTPKMVWKAADERLGIGTSSPSQGIHLKAASGNSYIKAERTTASQGEVGFNTDNWYMYQKPSSSDLHFYNTADRLTIDSSGNVGIGESDPQELLHLTDTTPVFRMQGASRTYQQYVSGTDFFIRDVTAGLNRITLDSSGKVGIGTSSPTTKLQSKGGSISSPTNNAGLIANASASFVVNHGNDYGLYTGYVASANDAIGIAATRTGGTALPLSLQPFGGNVGIGTSSPSVALDVLSSSAQIICNFAHPSASTVANNGGALVRIQNTNATNGNQSSLLFADSASTASSGIFGFNTNHTTHEGYMVFGTRDSAGSFAERMRILADGSVVQGNTVSLVASNFSNQAGAAWHEPDEHYEIATTSNVAPLEIGKNNANDGAIVVFRKQGTTVGSIGARGGDVYLETGNTGIRMYDVSDAIIPVGNTGVSRDGEIDLGLGPNLRFKDLYLSGDVITGGGGTGNTGEIQFVADSTRARIVGGYDSGGGGYIAFRTDTTGGTDLERARFNNAGNLAFTSGNGIDFSAVTGGTGTATSNVLDDYEEGTWTGTLTGSTSAPSTAITATGTYTKIGRSVTAVIAFSNKDSTGVSGNIVVTGLPFTAAAGGLGAGWNGRSNTGTGTTNGVMSFIASNNDLVLLNGLGASITWVSAGTGTYAGYSITYEV